MVTFIDSYLATATLMLLYNTIRDIRTRQIDSRFNYFAVGATTMLVAYFQPSLINLVIPAAISSMTIILFGVVPKFTGLTFYASGDLEAISWITFALGFFDYFKFVLFLIALTIFYMIQLAIHTASKRYPPFPPDSIFATPPRQAAVTDLGKSNRVAGYPMIMLSWLVVVLTFYLNLGTILALFHI